MDKKGNKLKRKINKYINFWPLPLEETPFKDIAECIMIYIHNDTRASIEVVKSKEEREINKDEEIPSYIDRIHRRTGWPLKIQDRGYIARLAG